ncbi:translational GTPase TypA [Candidatus Proelusimicrobium excrementi]|uniref:translational GTPase TypA n=1 Tax=Candidatus Proelusimicrobium excrementi TaxID=3416222 RepID=UPI003D12E975
MNTRKDIRNVAIIAHVDHGKTTVVDSLLKYAGQFKVKQDEAQETVLDSNPLERERGITILAKCTSVKYKDYTVNIVDTPGHADFGSEVERVLKMVDGAILMVDAVEGPMPQTRFVLRKALALGLRPIVVVNKMDRENSRPSAVVDEVFELFMELGADDKQLDFPILYASGREGWASDKLEERGTDIKPLFDAIIKYVPEPEADETKPLQMQVTMLDYNNFLGHIGIGRILNGSVNKGDNVVLLKNKGGSVNAKAVKIEKFLGLSKTETESAKAGDIVAISGLEGVDVGDTVCHPDNPIPLPPLAIDEPTISMDFFVNDSPFAGREGKFLTSRHLKARLEKEAQTNVGLKVEQLEGEGRFKVSGRGELHLTILIENMRREGFEFAVSKAEVLYKEDEKGKKLEPMEIAYIDVPEEFSGSVIQKLSNRKGELQGMTPINGGYIRLEFSIPSRGLIGYRGEFLTDTKGNGILNTIFDGYGPYKGDLSYRKQGSLIAFEAGEAITYGLFNAQERGTLFIGPGEKVYAGMVVGQTGKAEDIEINVCKKKQLTNTRSSSADEALRLTPPRILSLEQALEFIDVDELLEITPQSLRIRKRILDPTMRKRANFNKG